MNSEYKKIRNTNCYYVTSDGFVFKKTGDYTFKQVDAKSQPSNSGYVTVYFTTKLGKPSYKLIHRLVAEAFLPKPKYARNLEVNHKNGIKTDNRVENLEWVTRTVNMQKGWKNGQFANVSKAVKTKRNAMGNKVTELTDIDIRQIRHLKSEGLKNREIGVIFNLCNMQVSRIVNRRSWANVI